MFSKILLPIDLQDTRLADKAIEIAVDQARRGNAELHVVTVVPGFGLPIVASFFPNGALEEAMRTVARELKSYTKTRFPEDLRVSLKILEGHPAEAVLDQAKAIGADLIVIPSHASEFTRHVLGSCAASVVQHAACTVIVVKDEGRGART
jgi:universal stress protein F